MKLSNPAGAAPIEAPADPVAAASHADPYPYYRQLQQGPALVWNAPSGLWVASRAAVIAEVMGDPNCVVRPVPQPVPPAIAGTHAGAVFARLVRMNEGTAHQRPSRVLRQALGQLDLAAARATTRHWAAALALAHGGPTGIDLNAWMFDLPTYVVVSLLGFGAEELPAVVARVGRFVACLSPLSDSAQLKAASTAAADLQLWLRRLLDLGRRSEIGLAQRIGQQAAVSGWDEADAIVANLLGLLSQTHEATAGLIGNAIVALARRPEWQQRLRGDTRLCADFVREVCRHDAPIQNTRRFVAQPGSVAGIPMQAGDAILLLLGAAGRDADLHPQPDEFHPGRSDAPLAGFGHGRHACPGQMLALAIAAVAIEELLATPTPLSSASLGWRYRPSANARLPQFHYLPTPKEEPT